MASKKTVLVKYNDSAKVIQIPPEKPEFVFLKKECKKLFKFGSNVNLDITFQKYSAEWEEMVDIDENEYTLEQREKLSLVVQPTLSDSITGQASSSVASGFEGSVSLISAPPSHVDVDEESDDATVSWKSSRRPRVIDSDEEEFTPFKMPKVIESEQKEEATDMRLPEEDESSPRRKPEIASHDSARNRPEVVAIKSEEKPIPYPFPFPSNYRPEVEVCLKSGKMTTEARKSFMSSIASAMFSFKRYPKKEDFTRVATEIISKYPFLKAQSGSPTGIIVQTLINRFKEFRRVKRDKQAASLDGSTSGRQPVKPKSPGQKIAIPVIPPGEDETSFKRQNAAIRVEIGKKAKRNTAILNELVKQSFAMRRRDILENSLHVNVIIEKYPFLKEPDLFFGEIQRIANIERLRFVVRDSWQKVWSKRIMEQGKLEISSNTRLRTVMRASPDPHIGIFALCVLPYMLRDTRFKPDHEKIVYFCPESCDPSDVVSEKGQNEPYILITGTPEDPIQSFVVVDREIVYEVDINDCALALLGVFFVFNICYTKVCVADAPGSSLRNVGVCPFNIEALQNPDRVRREAVMNFYGSAPDRRSPTSFLGHTSQPPANQDRLVLYRLAHRYQQDTGVRSPVTLVATNSTLFLAKENFSHWPLPRLQNPVPKEALLPPFLDVEQRDITDVEKIILDRDQPKFVIVRFFLELCTAISSEQFQGEPDQDSIISLYHYHNHDCSTQEEDFTGKHQ